MPVSGVLYQFESCVSRLQFSEYAKVCSLYGVGFYDIPGTDICMTLGGYVRFQQNFGAADVTGGPFASVGGLNTRVSSEDQSYRVRWLLQHDTRQQTAYGTLRTYMILGFSQDSGTDTDITAAVRGAGVKQNLRHPRVSRRAYIRPRRVNERARPSRCGWGGRGQNRRATFSQTLNLGFVPHSDKNTPRLRRGLRWVSMQPDL